MQVCRIGYMGKYIFIYKYTQDGSGDEVIVTHGHTLTSKLNLIKILKCIKEYAFASSPYPVVLSIENHCSPKYVRLMGI